MNRRFRPRSTPAENARIIVRSIPWRLLILLPVLLIAAIPAYSYGLRIGARVMPAVTNFFNNFGDSSPSPTPFPHPAFPSALPQAGSLHYTVQAGDSCDEILAFQMHMADAGVVFSDAKPATVKVLNATIGKDCHALQPGMILTLSPQYPLVAFGGAVLKVEAAVQQQVLPTPLINVAHQQAAIDCSSSCLLTLRISPAVQIQLQVQTALSVRVGSWVWAQAMLPRMTVPGFDNYPYADPRASLNGTFLRACDLQVDAVHDDNSLSCDQLLPNTIDDDGGAWLLGVASVGSLAHWGYPLHLPAGTRVLLWLTADNNGTLRFHKGNLVYRFDEAARIYVRA